MKHLTLSFELAGRPVVVVGEGRILRSTNSGQAWSTVWSGGNDLRAVSFPSARSGSAGAAGCRAPAGKWAEGGRPAQAAPAPGACADCEMW